MRFFVVCINLFINLFYLSGISSTGIWSTSISLSWSDIFPELIVPSKRLLLTRKLLNQGFLLVNFMSSLRKVYKRHHDLVNRYEISVSHTTTCVPLVVSTSWSIPHSRLVTGFVTRVTRRIPLVEQNLLTIPEYLCSPLVYSGFRVARSLFFCVLLCRSLFILFLFVIMLSLCCLSFVLRVLVYLNSSMYTDGKF